jgi:hypothetical protein
MIAFVDLFTLFLRQSDHFDLSCLGCRASWLGCDSKALIKRIGLCAKSRPTWSTIDHRHGARKQSRARRFRPVLKRSSSFTIKSLRDGFVIGFMHDLPQRSHVFAQFERVCGFARQIPKPSQHKKAKAPHGRARSIYANWRGGGCDGFRFWRFASRLLYDPLCKLVWITRTFALADHYRTMMPQAGC